MMARKIVGILPFIVAMVLVQPLAAQTATGHVWTPHRPDAMGPASVTNHRTIAEGEVQVSLRYLNLKKNGVGWETDSLTVDEVWALGYELAPARLATRGFALDVLYAVRPDLTVSVSGTFAKKSLENWVNSTDNPSLYRFSETENSGLNDVEITGIYRVFEGQASRAFIHGGVSIPVGSVDAAAEQVDPDNLSGEMVEVRLPYQQQLGSGTFDLHPGFTVDIQNEVATLGLQGRAEIRLGENGQGWAPGNLYEGYGWAGFKATQWAAGTIGLKYVSWGDIQGMDEEVNLNTSIFQSPAYSTFQSGWRLVLPVGLNLMMPEGSALSGQRFSVEFLVPIHQKLDQPQLRQDMSIVARWSKAFGL